MKLSDFSGYLDDAVPLFLQESWDNSGLQVGEPDQEISSALLTLDITDEVMDEAVKSRTDLIVSHHPLIFSGLKRLIGQSATERLVVMAVKNNIAIYSAHTNLDSVCNGVSWKMAEKLNLTNVRVLVPAGKMLVKLVTFVPQSYLDRVRNAVFNAGAGAIGNYDRCGFSLPGTGSFRPGENTNPFVGEKGKVHFEKEERFETVIFANDTKKVIGALLDAHPYEEVAYDLYPLENNNVNAGMGCTGELPEALPEPEFLKLTASVFGYDGLRYSRERGKLIKKIAVCGGAGISFLNNAIGAGADAFITGDIKYHSFFDAGDRILLIDAGHFGTEKFSVEILYDLIIKKFPKFAVRFSETNTNPINYL
jgi:dinuclear metal center YbgI/SA1388 family protein